MAFKIGTPEVELDPAIPGVAYTVGLLQADGSHEGSLEGKGRVSLELSVRDQTVLTQIADILPCYSSIGRRSRATNFAARSETATLRLYDKSTRRAFANLGVTIGRKAEEIAPPAQPFAEADYLRGLLDGDGSVGFTRKGEPFVSFVTASPAAAEFFCRAVRNVCGVERSCRPNQRDGVRNIMVLNRGAAQLAAWAWYSPDVIGIERKSAAAAGVAQWSPSAAKAGRYGVTRQRWTALEDAVVLEHPPMEAAKLLGRTVSSVSARQWRLRRRVG
ncbi:LAGLIDADG family homing endonuclease [Nocardia sp. NPDC058497]|uniref:LAGLIDADG family homing endonuclease n=1 Tax=Nocardia sp. NPDC058497 TaxID=3346529 RepID=UPI00365895C0